MPEPHSHERKGVAAEPSSYRGGAGPGPRIAVFSRLLSEKEAAGTCVPVSPRPRDLSGKDGEKPNPCGFGQAVVFALSSLPAGASHRGPSHVSLPGCSVASPR